MDLNQIKLLLIEDDPDDALILKEQLLEDTQVSYDIVECQTLQKAKEQLTQSFDIAIIDLQLPDSRGLDTCKQILEISPTLSIVVVTGNHDDNLGMEAVTLGAQDFLVKNEFSHNDLRRVVRYALLRSKTQKQLESTNMHLLDFSNIVAHDFRNPLSTIHNFLSILKKSMSYIEGDDLEIIDRCIDTTKRLQSMTKDLLSYAKLGQYTENTKTICLQTLIQEITSDLESKTQSLDAKINAESLPKVKGYKSHLYQVFINLIENSIKYCGEEKPHIQISHKEVGDQYHIFYKDNGIGMKQSQWNQAFLPFQQCHNLSDGHGMGLTIVKKIIELHKGSIEILNSNQKGSTFLITIPK